MTDQARASSFILCIALLFVSSLAQAQDQVLGSCTTKDGSTAFTSSRDYCEKQNGNFYVPGTGVIGTSGSVITATTMMPKCADGWTLVSDLSMHPMCARELRKPE